MNDSKAYFRIIA